MKNIDYKIIINNEKMAMPFFSVIMLSYNSGKLIEKALRGIYKQSFTDYELILINDGSLDDTDDIVKNNLDQRLVYVKNNVNSGVGKSRELGINIAKGKYIIFVDVDDIVDKDLLLTLKETINEQDTDYIIYGYEERYIDKKNKTLWSRCRLPLDAYRRWKCENNNVDYLQNEKILNISDKDTIKSLFIYLEDETILGYPWNKCYKKQIIVDNDIHFEDYQIYEDILFNIKYYECVKSLTLINKRLYTYNNQIDKKSITKKDYDNYFELSKNRVKALYNYIKSNDKLDSNSLNILKRIYIRYAYSELNRCINRKWELKKIQERFEEIRNDELFKNILDGIKADGFVNHRKQKLFSRIMEDCFIKNKKIRVILIAQTINFINKYMYWLYLKIAK